MSKTIINLYKTYSSCNSSFPEMMNGVDKTREGTFEKGKGSLSQNEEE